MSEGDALIYKDVTGVTDSAAVTAALDVVSTFRDPFTKPFIHVQVADALRKHTSQ